MARSAGSNNPLQPMSVGSIVSAAFQLYRSRLKQYLGITWRATLWIGLAMLSLLVPILLLTVSIQSGNAWGLFALLLPVGVVLLIICSAKAGMNMAIVSRLAYGELVNQPEGVQAARRALIPRTWKFFWAQVLVNLILSMVNFGTSAVQVTLSAGAVFAFGAESIITVVVNIVVYLATLTVYLWFVARWAIPELPIAIENVGISQAVTRSWDLSKGNAFRILGVLFVAFLVTLPLYALSFVPFFSTLIAVAPRIALEDETAIIGLLTALGLSFLLFLLLNLFIVPFWQALKALIYYDLRARREGLDLQLRDRQNGPDLV